MSMTWFKKWLVLVTVFSSMAGCAQLIRTEKAIVDWKHRAFNPEEQPELQPPARLRAQTALPGPLEKEMQNVKSPEQQRVEYCAWAREQFHLPTLFNRELKSAANEKLGKDEAAKLFWPVARTNNAFRCLCGTPEEKKLAKC